MADKSLLHSIIVSERAISADGIERFDLTVNPLSVVLVALRPLNNTTTLTNWQSYRTLAAAMNRVSIQYNGASIFSMRGEDAAALAYFKNGIMPLQATHAETDNDRRIVVVPLLLGRFAYDPQSCFPATRRGELVLELDLDIADTGYDGLRLSVETIELLGATPKEFERKIDQRLTFAATGDNDVDLPVGNLLRGLLLFGTTGFTGASPAPSWGRLSLLRDNQEVGYSATDWEVAHMLTSLMGRQPPAMDGHAHLVDATQADANEKTHTGPLDVGQGGWQNYAYLDLDPTRDDMFSVDLRRSGRAVLRADAETADAVRLVTVEKIPVG